MECYDVEIFEFWCFDDFFGVEIEGLFYVSFDFDVFDLVYVLGVFYYEFGGLMLC